MSSVCIYNSSRSARGAWDQGCLLARCALMAGRLTERPSQQLARRGPRERRGELDPLRDLEAGERPGAVPAQVVGGGLRAVLEDDDGGHRLLPLRVVAADHGGVGDLGMAE